jgi:hypothetical protein
VNLQRAFKGKNMHGWAVPWLLVSYSSLSDFVAELKNLHFLSSSNDLRSIGICDEHTWLIISRLGISAWGNSSTCQLRKSSSCALSITRGKRGCVQCLRSTVGKSGTVGLSVA